MPAEIDKDLVTAVKTARGGKPMPFAFVQKGSGGKLLVAKKIAPKQVTEMKAEAGGGTVFRGRCVGVDGTLVFEMAKEPPATLLAQLKKRLKEDAGLTFPIDVRVVADAEDEGPEGEGEAPGPVPVAPPPAPDAAVDWKAKLAEWTPAIKKAIADKHPKAEQIQKFLQDAAGMAKPGGDYAAATLRLKAAFTLASAPPVAPGPTPPTPPTPGPTDTAAATKRFNALAGAIKAALAAKGPNAGRIQTLFVGVAGKIKAGDAAGAAALLDELEPLLAAPPAPAPTPGDGAPSPAGLKAWAAAREAAVKQLRAAAAKIGTSDDPDAVAAVIELQAVIKNLTANPATPQQVAELDRYLRTDDVITAAENIPPDFGTVTLRQPLLAALEQLKA